MADARDDFRDVELVVSGIRYSGWKSIRITRSMESIAGSFSLDVSDRWDGEKAPWPIKEEDHCRVEIGGIVAIDGYVDRRRLSVSATSRSLAYEGKDRAAALVECSAIVKAGTVSKAKWTFYNTDVVKVATDIARPFGISVSVQPGLGAVIAKEKKVVLHPGDKGFEVISKLAAAAGVMPVSDGQGGIVITRVGTERATPLVLGKNIIEASLDVDAANRYRKIIISSQVPGSDDDASEDDSSVEGEAVDLGVRRVERELIIRPDKSYTAADARRRADWEARSRAARAEPVSVTVQGWKQPNGKLWPINAVTHVEAPPIGVGGDMLISQVENTVSNEGGRVTVLSLLRPDAFTPEPTATVKDSNGLWKELDKGAL